MWHVNVRELYNANILLLLLLFLINLIKGKEHKMKEVGESCIVGSLMIRVLTTCYSWSSSKYIRLARHVARMGKGKIYTGL
jgi:hypothetical protein